MLARIFYCSIPRCGKNGVYVYSLYFDHACCVPAEQVIIQFTSVMLFPSGVPRVLNVKVKEFLLYVKMREGVRIGPDLSHSIYRTNRGGLCKLLATSYTNLGWLEYA